MVELALLTECLLGAAIRGRGNQDGAERVMIVAKRTVMILKIETKSDRSVVMIGTDGVGTRTRSPRGIDVSDDRAGGR